MKNGFIKFCFLTTSFLYGCSRHEQCIPERKDIVDMVFASGKLATGNQYLLASQTEGYIANSYVCEGDTVHPNQILFHIDDNIQKAQFESISAQYNAALHNSSPVSPILIQLNAQKAEAKNKLKTDSLNFVRYQALANTQAVAQVDFEKTKLAFENSQQEYQAIKSLINETTTSLALETAKAKANLVLQQNAVSYCTLKSSLKGVMLQIFKREGEVLKKGEVIAEIGSGDIVAKLLVAEEDINMVKCGQEVFIVLNTQKHISRKAVLTKIYPIFDMKEQSFVAEAKFTQPIPNIRSGTQFQAHIVVGQKNQALVIPSDYLLHDGFVLVENKKVKVRVGLKTSEWSEILGGLAEKTVLTKP